jgi:hypothetical protein
MPVQITDRDPYQLFGKSMAGRWLLKETGQTDSDVAYRQL